MKIEKSDLGKIVELPIKPEWGPGIISKVENRFAFIKFRNAEDRTAKRYFLRENPLEWSANQDRSSVHKRSGGRTKKAKSAEVTVKS